MEVGWPLASLSRRLTLAGIDKTINRMPGLTPRIDGIGGADEAQIAGCKGSAAERLDASMAWTRVGEVPHFGLNPDGSGCDRVFFYKRIEAA